jgi:hypothetical protein
VAAPPASVAVAVTFALTRLPRSIRRSSLAIAAFRRKRSLTVRSWFGARLTLFGFSPKRGAFAARFDEPRARTIALPLRPISAARSVVLTPTVSDSGFCFRRWPKLAITLNVRNSERSEKPISVV